MNDSCIGKTPSRTLRWGLPLLSVLGGVAALLLYRETRLGLAGVTWLLIVPLFWALPNRRCLGLTVMPAHGWWFWIRIGLILGPLLFILMFLGLRYSGIQGDTQLQYLSSSSFFWRAVVWAPWLEEPIYRLLLCLPLVPLIGARATVVVSGLVFAHMHYHFGVLGPDNAVAGFFLAWSYIKSESLVVPILYHGFGNGILALAAALQLAS